MSATTPLRLLVGIGNAGVAVLDRISLEHPGMKGLLVVNNDPESLAASVVADKLPIPEGDPREGFLAIEEAFKQMLDGASSVILCGGLGGETGSFFLPALAALAKVNGITTLASVGIPFAFEGRQKRETAALALRKLQDLCDAVAVIDNDRLSGGVPSTAAVGEAFIEADRTLQASLLALRGMLSTSGPVKISRADLVSVLGIPGAMTHFGHGRSEGSNRLHEALEMAMKSPLLTVAGKSSALKEAATVLLLLSGPSDLSFAEVQRAVGELERIAGDRALVKVGVHAEGSPGAPLDLALITSSGSAVRAASKKQDAPEVAGTLRASRDFSAEEAALMETNSDMPPAKGTLGTARNSAKQTKSQDPTSAKRTGVKQTQGVLDLETYQRGRFDKSEPTIVAGEDLDIPTFLRKGIKIGSPSRH